MSKSIIAGLVALTCACTLSAQRPVVTVGGINPNHTDLPQAIAAAAPGSIVEVRPGTYTGFTCQKALRVVLTNATVNPPAGANYTIRVENIAGSDPFVIRGVATLIESGVLGAMSVSNVQAPVIIEKVTLLGDLQQAALQVLNSGSVHVARAILIGDPALDAQFCNFISTENLIGNSDGAGAVISDSSLDSARTVYVGTDEPALRISDTDARLASDGSSGMFVIGSGLAPVSAFEAFDSDINWTPSLFQLGPANGAPALSAQTTTEVIEDVPMLNAGPAVLGGTAVVRMTSETQMFGAIAMNSLLATPISLPLGRFYINPLSFVMVGTGFVGTAGLQFNVSIPNDPTLRGEVFAFQGLTFLLDGSIPLSGPALWYIE
tara:strand:+ start:4179 stop:5309 length:1131 start_codon:yes stop_codon:yes gene_type:complete